MAENIEIPATRLRPEMRRCLNNTREGGTVTITRHGEVEAVMVSPEWYQRAAEALDRTARAGE
jgi:prevent-host-death family protein